MQNTNTEMTDLKLKATHYKAKLDELSAQKQEVDRQLILMEEQYNQYKEKIEQAFSTSDPEELSKIAQQYLKDIEALEKDL